MYAQRRSGVNSDGTPTFATDEDRRNENAVSTILEATWKCELRPFGTLSPLDRYAIRDGRMVAIVEIKCRSHSSDRFATVFLNLRKWNSMMLACVGHGVPAVFVVKFTDRTGFINVAEIDASRIKIAGCSQRVKSGSDIEPVIEVEVSQLTWI